MKVDTKATVTPSATELELQILNLSPSQYSFSFANGDLSIFSGRGTSVTLGMFSKEYVPQRRVRERMERSDNLFSKVLQLDPSLAQTLVESAPIIVLLLSPDGEIQFVNRHFTSITGYEPDEICGRNWFETFLPKGNQAHIRKIFEAAITGSPTRANVNPILTRHGAERQIEWSDTVIYDSNDKPVSLLAVGMDVTEAIELEQERENNRQHLRSILDGMFAFVGLYDLQGNLLEANRAPLEAAGLERSEVIGKPFWDAYWWSYSPQAQNQVRDALFRAAKGETIREDFIVRIKGGVFITIDAVFGPLRDANGKITGVVGSGVDITARKQAEERLRASQTQLSQAQEMAKIGSWDLDLVNDRLTWSDEIYRMFGVSSGVFDPSYERFLSFVHPDDRQAVDTAYKESVANRQPYRIEHRLQLQDGSIKVVEERCQTWYDDHGNPLRSVGTIQDITERKDLEREVSHKAALLETTFQNMSQGIAVFDADQRLVAFNKKYEEFGRKPPGFLRLGMTREEVLRQKVEIGEIEEETLPVRLTGAGARTGHWREQVHPDGTVVLYERTPLPDGGVIGTYTDVTELKAAEESLRAAQKMQAVGQLTGGIAHDFNNLLAVILGNIDLLVDELGEDNQSLGLILRAAERGAELTHRLLAFSRRQSLHPEPVDLCEALNGLRTLLQRTLGETIKVAIILPPDLWLAQVDAGQLENAIINLAINARDAMPEGGNLTFECSNIRLNEREVEDISEMKAGDYIALAVTDTGTGMAAEILDHVFEPFFTTKEAGAGSGLGLSMVYGFSKQTGGHVGIESRVGSGTTITLYLPRAKEMKAVDRTPESEEMPIGRGERVLVLEDDLDVCTSVQNMLDTLGYSSITAQTAEEAGRTLECTKVDLVLSDVVLAGDERGPVFAEQARALYPELKIIFMSGYSGEAASGKAALSDKEVLIKKPFRRRELAGALRSVLS